MIVFMEFKVIFDNSNKLRIIIYFIILLEVFWVVVLINDLDIKDLIILIMESMDLINIIREIYRNDDLYLLYIY